MAQVQNQFAQTPEKGQLDLMAGGSVITCQVDATQSQALVPGQAVTCVDSAGGVPKVIAAAADTADVFGFVKFSFKDQDFPAGAAVEIAIFRGSVMFMQSSAAIARYAQVMPVIAGQKVATAAGAGKRIVGRALDKATAADQLIRVLIDLPGAVVP